MTASIPPENREPTNAELKTVFESKMSEILAVVKNQGTQLADFNQRLLRVEGLAMTAHERSRKVHEAQSDLEGSLLREVGVLASNDRKQNAELAKQSGQLTEILSWKKAAALLVMGAPGAWELLQWLVHK